MYNNNGDLTILQTYFRTILTLVVIGAGGILTYIWYDNSKPLAKTVDPDDNGIQSGMSKVKNEINTW